MFATTLLKSVFNFKYVLHKWTAAVNKNSYQKKGPRKYHEKREKNRSRKRVFEQQETKKCLR